MYIAALSRPDGLISSIVEVDDVFWQVTQDAVVGALASRGFDWMALDSVFPHEIERRIACWADLYNWRETLTGR